MKGISLSVLCLLLMAFGRTIGSLNATICQLALMKKCNGDFKNKFQNSAVLGTNKEQVYCPAMQNFMNCLNVPSCNASFVNEYRYVVLQHGMMDKKSLICPNHTYMALRNLVKSVVRVHLLVDDIGRDHWAACASVTHHKCVNEMTKNLETNTNMCQDMRNFINCYENEKNNCSAKIVKHFTHMCKKLGEKMLTQSKKTPGLMC